MRVSVTSETLISFDLEVETVAGVLRLDGGEWELSQDGERQWVAAGRVHWTKAIGHALALMQEQARNAEVANTDRRFRQQK